MTPADVTVRKAGPTDVDALASLKIEWSHRDAESSAAERAEFASDLRQWMREHERDLVAAIAVDGAGAVGMAWMVVFERVPDVHDRTRFTADIQSVYVKPSWRRQGIGQRMVELLCGEADARGIPRVIVSGNERATPLYRRVGFEQSSTLLVRRRPA